MSGGVTAGVLVAVPVYPLTLQNKDWKVLARVRPDLAVEVDGTVDELDAVIADFAGCDTIEVYPAESRLVNVANMRHLWIMEQPLNFGL